MSGSPETDLYAIQVEECYELYQQEKFAECIAAARFDLTDPTLPRYVHIKTLTVIANAEDDWEAAEECRIEAERLYQVRKQRIREQTQELSNKQKEAMKELRNALDTTLASQAEGPPEYVRRAFSCWPPREGNIEDAFAAQDHEVEDDNDEQLDDDEGVAAAEQQMEPETVGHLDQESEKEPEEKQDEGDLNSIAIRPKENQNAEGKPEGEGGPAEEAKSPAKSPAKSLVFARKRSTKVVKQPARRRF